MALKFSIGIFLLRIAVVRSHRIIIWTTIAVLELYGAFYFFLFVLQCRPSTYFWTRYTGGEGSCINANTTVIATYVYSGISCATDWILGIIPIFLVWNVQMNPRTKVSVALILGLGAMYVALVTDESRIDQNIELQLPQLFGYHTSRTFQTKETFFMLLQMLLFGPQVRLESALLCHPSPLYDPYSGTSSLGASSWEEPHHKMDRVLGLYLMGFGKATSAMEHMRSMLWELRS